MKLTICASMCFTEQALALKQQLEKLGHTVYVSKFASAYIGKSMQEKEQITIFHKNEKNAIREHWNKIKKSNAIIVLNLDKREIRNYIGGNTLMEIGFAHVLHKKIYLMNPIPKIRFYQSEIEAMKPIILNGNLKKIK